MDKLLGYHRNEQKLVPIFGFDARYRTAKSDTEPGREEREIVIVACNVSTDFAIQATSPHVDQIEPEAARDLLKSGVFFQTTTPNTKGQPVAGLEYALLMSYARKEVYSGRGGVLLYKDGDDWRPVILKIKTANGYKEFLVDLKGTGTPDGKLLIDPDRGCIGGLLNGSENEHNALVIAEQQHPLATTGNVPMPLYYGVDDRGFSQVARAIPVSMRSSFRENDAFERLQVLTSEEIAYGLGLELGRYLAFDPPHIATNLQTENAYLVDREIIATDFMEILPLHESISPILDIIIAISIIRDSVYQAPDALKHLALGIIKGLKEVNPNIPVAENDADRLSSPEDITEYLLSNYLAEAIIAFRRKSRLHIDAEYLKGKFDRITLGFYNRNPSSAIPRQLLEFLREEERLFHYLSQKYESDTEIIQVLAEIKRIIERIERDYSDINITRENVTDYEALIDNPYYYQVP